MIFHLEKNNKFGLEYPSLEKRKDKCISFIIEKLKEIDHRERGYTYEQYYSKDFKKIIELNKNSKNWTFDIDNFSDYNPSDIMIILENQSKDYFSFLYFLEIILENFLQIEELKNDYKNIANWINKFDLDYKWDFKNNELKRVLDKGNLSIINSNIKNIKQDKDNFLIYLNKI